MTRIEPHAVTAAHVVTWHVNNADNPDPRFRGDVDWARRFLAEWAATGWLTETEANEIRAAVGWDVTAVQKTKRKRKRSNEAGVVQTTLFEEAA